ncbi:MAG: ATP-dependent DNA helicase RecG [Ruminococcaceae bacterium]|nr:ATP-dependent DNA helicase RecG [Oscillospiraceae bacterium]
MKSLNTSIQYVKGVGAKRAALFARLGVETLEDLIRFYPRAYKDWSDIQPIAQTQCGETACIKATCIQSVQHFVSPKSGIKVFSTRVSDNESTMEITIFNNVFAASKLEFGKDYYFFGKVEGNLTERKMVNPEIESASAPAAIKPIYPLTGGLTSTIVSKVMAAAFAAIEPVEEPFPPGLVRAYGLCGEWEALQNIHFPESQPALESAKKRLIFDELLYLQLGLLSMKAHTAVAHSPQIGTDYSEEFAARLPYTLTGAQQRVIAEAIADFRAGAPMSRLVQGDVGSGKTAVAMSLMYTAAKNGMQSAMMAPTEILAEQHFDTIAPYFETAGMRAVLLTGSMTAKQKREAKALIAAGEAAVVIGTHALIQGDVAFSNLGLVIADEQHRFGVKQRSALAKKGENVNLLVMSATPIPRTLALFIYGELDISILDEMPAGRQRIDTFVVNSTYRRRLNRFIKQEIQKGRQAYIVCPLVEEGENEDLLSATAYAEELKNGAFADCRLAVLHGKMKGSEKDAVMRRFKAGEIDILVATTVIEVGIDVPNATVMVIENAERFGLSQLHQLRGRIGRGAHQSYCVLVSDNESQKSVRRLETMKHSADGFAIAEEDLKLRGPGDFFGERQHGLVNLKIANLLTDMETLTAAGDAARTILAADPLLQSQKYAGLKQGVENFFAEQRTDVN